MVNSPLRQLFLENPMLIEASRFKRRFFESGRGKTVNMMVLAVAAVAYGILLLVIANFAGDIDPVVVVYIQTAVFALLAPSMLHGSIAGERDRRYWDLLLVAPISRAQIVVGKLLAALGGLVAGFVAFLIPTMFAAITYKPWIGHAGRTYGEAAYALLLEELISISFGVLACAVTLFLSARSRRAFTALAVGLSVMFVWLIVLPILLSVFTQGSGAGDALLYLHPFVGISKVDSPRPEMLSGDQPYPGLSPGWFGWPQILLYLVLSVVFVAWAQRTLTYADGDRRVLSGAPSA